jgi:hypothetical protein
MKLSAYIVAPPYPPIPVVVMTNKTSHCLKIRKGEIGSQCLDGESIHLMENRVALENLLTGKTITL